MGQRRGQRRGQESGHGQHTHTKSKMGRKEGWQLQKGTERIPPCFPVFFFFLLWAPQGLFAKDLGHDVSVIRGKNGPCVHWPEGEEGRCTHSRRARQRGTQAWRPLTDREPSIGGEKIFFFFSKKFPNQRTYQCERRPDNGTRSRSIRPAYRSG